MLFRKIESTIREHLQSNSNKIMLIDGARQIGKTYIIRYVGKALYKNYIEINLMEDFKREQLFANITSVNDFYLNETYNVKKGIVFSNAREVRVEENGTVYMPIYYIMFFKPNQMENIIFD